VHEWIGEMFHQTGSEVKRTRERALPLPAQYMTRIPDVVMSGPGVSLDEMVRR
jgi:hypothetical protein